jgi:5'(3')-deoxyribonucleotidase
MITTLIDCDGLICNFLGGVLDAVNKDCGTNFQEKDCDKWDIAAAYGTDWKYLSSLIEKPGFCFGLKPFPGAVEAVRRLDLRTDVYCVTSPFSGAYWMPERTAWLKEYFGFDKSHVIHCYTKKLIRGDFLIDDKPENIAEWSAAWPAGTGILWDATYNKNAVNVGNHRAYCWDYVMELVGC